MAEQVEIYFDGACDNKVKSTLREMGIGACMFHYSEQGRKAVKEASVRIKEGSSNKAEYYALIAAINMAVDYYNLPRNKNRNVRFKIYGDSKLIVNQFNGEWLCKNKGLAPLMRHAVREASKLGQALESVSWIPREKNTKADELSKRALGK